MGPSNSSYLSNIATFHFHDYGGKYPRIFQVKVRPKIAAFKFCCSDHRSKIQVTIPEISGCTPQGFSGIFYQRWDDHAQDKEFRYKMMLPRGSNFTSSKEV